MAIFDRFPGESDEVWQARLDDLVLLGTNWREEFRTVGSSMTALGAIGLEGYKQHTLAERARFEAEFGPEFEA